MGTYIDFAELKERVSIEEVASVLDLELKRSNNQLRGPCPVCDGGDRSLVVTPSKGAFYCFDARAGGDQLALAAHILAVPVKDAAIKIAERYGIGTGDSTGTSASDRSRNRNRRSTAPQERRGDGGKSLEPLQYLKSDHEAVIAVGFDPQDAEALGIGYAGRGLMRGLVAIPLRMPDGTLVGYCGVIEAKLPSQLHIPSNNVVQLRKPA